MSDTPKHWKQYLDSLDARFEKDMKDWEKEKKEIEASKNETWAEKLFDHKSTRLEHHEWDKPYRGERTYDPSLIDYFNWDVNERKKKNVRT